MMKSTDCLTHETAGTASARTNPRKHSSSDARLSPARNEASANSISKTRLVAGAGFENKRGFYDRDCVQILTSCLRHPLILAAKHRRMHDAVEFLDSR